MYNLIMTYSKYSNFIINLIVKLYLCGILISRILPHNLKITIKIKLDSRLKPIKIQWKRLLVFLLPHCVFVALHSANRLSIPFKVCYQASEWQLPFLSIQNKDNRNCIEKKKNLSIYSLKMSRGKRNTYKHNKKYRILYTIYNLGKREKVRLQLKLQLNSKKTLMSSAYSRYISVKYEREIKYSKVIYPR